jgi:hypothetical protein
VNSHLRRSSASPGSSGAAAPSPGVIRAGRRTRSSSRKSCCRGPPRPGLRGPTPGSSSATPRGQRSRKRPRWPRERTQAARALAAKGAGLSIPGTVRRRARWRHSSHAGRTGAPAGDRPLHSKRGAGHRVRSGRSAPGCEHDPSPGAVPWISWVP